VLESARFLSEPRIWFLVCGVLFFNLGFGLILPDSAGMYGKVRNLAGISRKIVPTLCRPLPHFPVPTGEALLPSFLVSTFRGLFFQVLVSSRKCSKALVSPISHIQLRNSFWILFSWHHFLTSDSARFARILPFQGICG
jgi:hypothetical protein